MKYEFCLIASLAFVTAQGIQDETPLEAYDEDAYSTSTLYSVPAPSAGYPAASSDSIVPSALPTEVTSDNDSCSTALITITTTRTVSIITQIPSSLLTVTGIVELSSLMPSQPPPSTSATGVVEISSWVAPQPSSSAVAIIVLRSSATDIGESSVAPPQVPYPTASDKPISTTAIGTTSATSAGLPVFTDAADAVRAPVVVAGILWWAALVL